MSSRFEGAEVVITGRRQPELDKAVDELGEHVTAVRGDVSDLADLDRLYASIAARERGTTGPRARRTTRPSTPRQGQPGQSDVSRGRRARRGAACCRAAVGDDGQVRGESTMTLDPQALSDNPQGVTCVMPDG